jgi:hypothetical protein
MPKREEDQEFTEYMKILADMDKGDRRGNVILHPSYKAERLRRGKELLDTYIERKKAEKALRTKALLHRALYEFGWSMFALLIVTALVMLQNVFRIGF